MIAISKSPRPTAQAHQDDRFLEMIPAIQRYARSAFRNLRSQNREEAISAVVADAFFAFRRLVELGKQDVAYATPLARFAVRRYWTGRCACMPRGRDMMSRRRNDPRDRRRTAGTCSTQTNANGVKLWLRTDTLAPPRLPLHDSTSRHGSARYPDGTAGLPKPCRWATRPAMRPGSSESPGHGSASCEGSCRPAGQAFQGEAGREAVVEA